MIGVKAHGSARYGSALAAGLVLSIAAAPLPAFADERSVFRSQMPDGRVVYADAPVAGAVRSARLLVELHPGDPAQALAAQQALEATRERLLREAHARALRAEQLDERLRLATGELSLALSAQAQGEAIGEGDRQGRRLTPSYWQRQQRLDAAVAIARERLNALGAERAGLR